MINSHDMDPATDFCRRCGAGAMRILDRRLACGGGDNVVPVSHIISRRRFEGLMRGVLSEPATKP